MTAATSLDSRTVVSDTGGTGHDGNVKKSIPSAVDSVLGDRSRVPLTAQIGSMLDVSLGLVDPSSTSSVERIEAAAAPVVSKSSISGSRNLAGGDFGLMFTDPS